MSGWLSRRLVERGIIKEEEQEIYQFGIRNGMIILLNVLTALLIGLVTDKLFVRTEDSILIILLTLAVCIIMIFSPIHSKNRKLDEAEQKHFGRKARMIAVIQLIVLGVLWYMEQDTYAYAIYSSICITAVLMLIGKVQLWLQVHIE